MEKKRKASTQSEKHENKEAPEMQKTTMNMDPEFHKKLRILTILKGINFTKLVNQALQEFLEREEKKERGKS